MRDISRSTGKSQNHLKNNRELQSLRESAAVVRDLLIQLKKVIRPGVNELDIATFCENYILIRNADPYLKTEGIYPHAVLISTNNQSYHGVPEDRVLSDGDIITVDVVLQKNGWFGDGAWTYEVGECVPESHRLVEFSRKLVHLCVDELEKTMNFSSLIDLVDKECKRKGYRVIGEGAGHGIGKGLHEDPLILFSGEAQSEKLEKGLVFTVEPVITNDPQDIVYDDNGMASVRSGYIAAQFEHMVAVCDEGLEILTDPLTLFK